MAGTQQPKTADICAAVGKQVMDALNETGAPIAVMGSTLRDSTYEFLLGPVYLPHDQVSMREPAETRRLLVNLRLDDQERPPAENVRWMCKRGDEYAMVPQPAQAIVIEKVEADPDTKLIHVFHHNSA